MLLSVPALRAIKHRRPGAPLTLAAQPRIGALLQALDLVDRAVALDALGLGPFFSGEARAPAAALRAATAIVSWFGSRDPDFVRRLRDLVPDTIVAPSTVTGRPVWEHLVATLGASPSEADRWREPVPVPPRLVEEGRRSLHEAGWDGRTPLLLVHPGAGGVAKRWPSEGFRVVLEELALRMRLAVVLHQGPADAEPVAALCAALAGRCLRLMEPPLLALVGILACSTAYLGNDSGVSHLAASLGVPSVVLFTASKLHWRPWAPRAEPLLVDTSTLDPADYARVVGALAGLLTPPSESTPPGAACSGS